MMNPNNPLYKYAELLNTRGQQLVRQFMMSEHYRELRLKIAKIDADMLKAEQEYRKRIRELKEAKRNIELYEIPNAKDEYVREHLEGYKMYFRTKDADNPIEVYMQIVKSELTH